MVAYAFKDAKFIKSAVQPKDFPVLKDLKGHILPEIAVVGRSNVGKSTLLNHLFLRKNLVKTSSVPGKTQAINFFTLNDQLAFVDLPGYGYAEAPMQVRREWQPMIGNYLTHRESLKLILFLFDIRRVPNEEDKTLLEWLVKQEKALILVLTKIDKVGKNEKNANAQKILKVFDLDNLHYVPYSATENIGRKELIKMLLDAIKDETNASD